jgi:hypothetical protein
MSCSGSSPVLLHQLRCGGCQTASCLTFGTGTLGIAFGSFLSYGFLFNKPRSVKTAVIFEASVFDLDRHVREAMQDERSDLSGEHSRASLPNDVVDPKLARKMLPPLKLAFGAIRFAAWNSSFPTTLEQWL